MIMPLRELGTGHMRLMHALPFFQTLCILMHRYVSYTWSTLLGQVLRFPKFFYHPILNGNHVINTFQMQYVINSQSPFAA